MPVTQYIGARYVPLFADPLDWDSGSEYEPLTIVYYQGNSYTSRQAVPKGIDITNDTYWAITGNYNAQIDAYRREVRTFDGRITANETSIADIMEMLSGDAASGLKQLIDGLDTDLTDLQGDVTELDGRVTSDVTAINASIDSLTESLARNNVYYGTKSIGFGDSNMAGGEAGATENIYYRICQMLGCTNDNRGINGATIQTTGDGKDILPSIQSATADPDVRLVVLIGGINDYHYVDYNYTNFSNAARACVNEILTKFVNADVVIIWDQGRQHPNARMLRYPDALNGCATMSRTRKILSIPTYDLAFNENWYTSQNHWNGNGCNVVAQRACAYLLGGTPFPALTYRVSVSPESGVSNCSATVQKIAHLDVVAIDQYADIHFSENFAASSYTTLFNLPIGIDGKLGSGDTYFDVGYPIGDAKSARFNLRQWQSNYESVTDSPTLVMRNRNAIAAADVANEFDIRLSIPLRPQQ